MKPRGSFKAKNYSGRPKLRPKNNRASAPAIRLKPGADSSLKAVFKTIGVPEDSPFSPDPFQLEALEAIEKADCLVTAPTGSGKPGSRFRPFPEFGKKAGAPGTQRL